MTPGAAAAVDAPAVAARVAAVRARLAELAPGRSVRIVAVTKGFGDDAVEAAVAAGVTAIGENYGQELVAKAARGAGGDVVRWHYIGAVQRNKVAQLAPFVAVWESVDRIAAAEAIARHSPGATALIEVNLVGDPDRTGCAWDAVPGLVEAARHAGLTVIGLMGVGPAAAPDSRLFARLAGLAGALGLPELSMGMSADYELAVVEGATIVRLGTALFGPRPPTREVRR